MKSFALRLVTGCVAVVVSWHSLRGECTVTCTATVPATASTGASVAFQSTASPCACSGAPTYLWTFGDGSDSTAANPSHAYTSAGTYNWQLTVTADSTTCTKSGSIVVGGVTPVAGTYSGTTSLGHAFSLTVNGSSQITGWNVSYSDLCSASGSTGVSGTNCAIGDGAFTCGNATCSPTALLTSISGTFTSSTSVGGTVTLKHQPGFDLCCTQTPTFTASTGGAALVAGASADVSSGDAPLTVNFTGSASGGTPPYTYSWNFGDCTPTSSTQNPSHVYAAGNWFAVLTVTDDAAATDDAVVPISAVPIGITVTPTSGLVTGEGGETDTFSVVLQSQPDANVTIQLDTSDATEGRISIDGVTQQDTITLTFTTSNWSTPQVVTVHGQNDPLIDGDVGYSILTAAADSTDPSYDGIDSPNVFATNGDNDVAGVTVAPTTASVLESGTTDDFTVVLNTQPTGNVVIDIASTDTGEATVAPAQLTFTSGDWATPQPVTVTGVDDALADGNQLATVTVTIDAAATADENYDPINPADVIVTTIDDDSLSIVSTNPIANENAAPRNTNVQATASTTIDAATVTQSTFRVQGEQTGRIAGTYGGSGTSFQLDPSSDFKPGELIKVTATSGIESPSDAAMTPRVWHFTAATAPSSAALMRRQTLTAGTAINVALGDLDGDGDLDAFVGNRTEDDTVWSNNGSGAFTLLDTISSDWTMDVTLGDLDGDGDLDAVLANNGGGHTVWLNNGTGDFSAHPTTPTVGTGNVNAVALGDLDGDGDLDAIQAQQNGPERVWLNDGSGAFTAHATPSFGGDNSWDVALGDLDNDGDLDAVVANQLTQPETVWLNNGAGVFASGGNFGASDSRAVALGDLDGDGDLDAVVANVDGNETVWRNNGSAAFSAHPSVPSFDGGDGWGVTLGDLDGDGDLDAIATSAGGSETVWRNEKIVLSATGGLTTSESGTTSSFTIVLGAAPTADVSIHVETSDATEGRISSDGATQQNALDVVFTTSDWSTPRTITLHGQNDALDDGNIAYTITIAAATSGDAAYSGVDAPDVGATNLDDDTAGVNVSTETVTLTETTTANFTVVLTSQPAGDVVIDLSSSDTGEATVSPAQLTFTTANWLTPRNVTVTGVNDFIIDGDQNVTIGVSMNVGATADAQYDAIDPNDVTATVEDAQSFNILSLSPAANARAVARDLDITATASDTVNAATVTQTTFRVQGDFTGRIAGAYSASGATFQLNPTANLKPGETVKLTATSGIQNGTGAGLDPRVWQFTAAAGSATSAFARLTPEGTGDGWSMGAALGDLDADGDLDVVVANPSVENEVVWRNDGTGALTAVTPAFEGGGAHEVGLGDIDGDGDLDAVFAAHEGNTVWLNGGNADFSPHPTTPTFGAPGWGRSVALGDLDGDGDLDAGVANESGESLTIWRNDGAGNFTAHPETPTLSSGTTHTVVFGDLDADGDLDVVTASFSSDEFVWLNDGSGALTAHPVTPTFDGGPAAEMAIGDVNGDGDLDLVIANWAGPERVFANNGSGAFSLQGSFGGDDTRGIALGDLDGDGDLDVVACDNTSNSVWRNNGLGSFTPHPLAPTFASTASASVEFGDFDGDGDLDVFLADPNRDSVWLNRAAAGVTRTPGSVTVSESGTNATFTVVLTTPPVGNVVIDVASSDTGESSVSPSQLTFTMADWSTPQTVTVTGVDDALDDNNQTSTIALTMNAAATNDPLYDAVDPADVLATTTDDEKTATTTTLASTPNPSTSGQTVTLTATVTTGGAGTITGTVTFKDGSTTIGTATIASGSAVLKIASLAPGTRALTAVYSGNAMFLGGTSNTVNQVVNASPFGAPPFFTATAISTTQVALNWGAVSGATSYEVWRTTSISAAYTLVNTIPATSFTDSGRTANTTYLYKVRANGSGGPSAFSAVDAATTILFTDATLTNFIAVKQIHITQLRTAVNAMRAAGALAPETFTEPTPTIVKRIHLIELRNALDAARAAIGLAALGYTDPTITATVTRVKGAHITELRVGVQ